MYICMYIHIFTRIFSEIEVSKFKMHHSLFVFEISSSYFYRANINKANVSIILQYISLQANYPIFHSCHVKIFVQVKDKDANGIIGEKLNKIKSVCDRKTHEHNQVRSDICARVPTHNNISLYAVCLEKT
jgi:hypothetical protein